jgi:hypothetical protein
VDNERVVCDITLMFLFTTTTTTAAAAATLDNTGL